MKVGFVLSQPFGHSIGTDVRVRGLLEGLSLLGAEVHVIMPFVGNSSSSGRDSISVHRVSSISTRLKIHNLTYRLSKRFMINPFLFKRVFCRKSLLLRYVRSLKGICKVANRLDLDILQGEQQVASVACIKIGRKLRLPVVADFHGIWAEEMAASGIINHGDACYRTLFELEREIACSADAVTVVSEEMKNYVESSFGAFGDKVVLIPNATFPRVDSAKVVETPSKIIHSGTLHAWENVELFVKAMPFILKHYPSAKFYLTRKGAKLNKIRKLAHALGVFPQFIWFDRGSDFFAFLKSCDVGVISSTTHIARKMAYPAKLYDYLSVGLPIVANDVGAWTRIIRKNMVGVVTSNNPEAFAEGVLELLEDPELLYKCGQRGIDLVKHELNYYKSAEKLLDLYRRLA